MKTHPSTRLQKYNIRLIFFFLISVSCKSLDLSNPGPMRSIAPTRSIVNVPFEMPKKTLDRVLNSQIPATLIKEENLDMGSGIEGNLIMTRNGSVSWVVLDSQKIQLKLPVKVEGSLGLKRGGLGNLFRGKVPIHQEFEPVFNFNPDINPNWSLSIRDFELVDLGGNLKLDVLGLKLDLTGLMERELRRWATQNLKEGSMLLNFRPFIELAWQQAGKPFFVDWQGERSTFSIQPEKVKFREFFDSEGNFNVWLGLDGKINTHPAKAAPSRAFPLPNLSRNENSENQLEILLPLAVNYKQLDELIRQNLEGKRLRINKKTTLNLSEFQSGQFGELIVISTDYLALQHDGKKWYGKFFVVGKPSYDSEIQSLIFEDLNFKLESSQSRATLGAALKKRKIIRQIKKRAIFPIGDLLYESAEGIRNRLSLETGVADLKITDLKISPDDFIPQTKELLIYMKAKGKVTVNWK